MNPLISFSDLQAKAANRQVVPVSVGVGNAKAIEGANFAAIKQSLSDIKPETAYQFWTEGKWHLHNLIQFVVANYTGPCELWLTSWTVTEEPARALVGMKEKGLLTSINCLFDYRIKDRKPKPLQYLLNATETHNYTRIHAKAAVLWNETSPAFIVGSSNLSQNPRNEAGTLFTQMAVCRSNRDYISNKINGIHT